LRCNLQPRNAGREGSRDREVASREREISGCVRISFNASTLKTRSTILGRGETDVGSRTVADVDNESAGSDGGGDEVARDGTVANGTAGDSEQGRARHQRRRGSNISIQMTRRPWSACLMGWAMPHGVHRFLPTQTEASASKAIQLFQWQTLKHQLAVFRSASAAV
jgi:hypothetical protein